MTKKILSFFILFIICNKAFNQKPEQMPTGSVYGKIVDSASGTPIEAASVQLSLIMRDSISNTTKDSVINGMLTQKNGEFRLEGIPVTASYQLTISAIGHRSHTESFVFTGNKPGADKEQDRSSGFASMDKDLGNIRLATDTEVLEAVSVTGSKPTVQLGIDRKIYTVENNLVSSGGTATDVLKNVPSVNVDIDGNISVRNASPQIFVDGRPTTLTLDQIPADQVETVEVITNPSAKYDASGGTAGILNIVLKKTKRVGYDGSFRAGIDQRGRYNWGGNINVRQGKFNVFANLAYNQRKSISDGTTDRSTFVNDTTINLRQTDRNISPGRFMFGRVGFDYFLDNRNTITVSGMGVEGKFDNFTTSHILVDTLSEGEDMLSRINRRADQNFRFRMMGGSLGFVHNFPKTGHQLTADGQLNRSNNESVNLLSNDVFSGSNGAPRGVSRQQQNGKGNSSRTNAQIDYTNPLSEKSKLEAGLRLNQRETFSENIYNLVAGSGTLTPQPLLSSKFDYRDRVFAGYTTFTSKIGEKFGYQLGLRLESSDYRGTVNGSTNRDGSIVDMVSHFSISYPASLFPSIFLSQDLGNRQQLQLNYSRRITRPGFFQLFPFVDYSDSLNLSRGNPNLRPEFTHSVELSYSKNFNRGNNVILSAYYKNTNDLLTRYQSTETNPATGELVLVNTFMNANSSFVGGFEAVGKNSIAKWWDVTSNLNIYTSKITIDDPSIPTADQIYSWFAKMNNIFKLPANFTFQLSGDYNSRTVLSPGGSAASGGEGGGGRRGGFGVNVSGDAQGYSMPTYGVDVALKYEFLEDKAASVTLSGNDILKTRVNDVYTTTGRVNQHQVRVRDQQFFSINFAYRFGKFDASLLKRKNMKADQEGGMQQGMPQ